MSREVELKILELKVQGRELFVRMELSEEVDGISDPRLWRALGRKFSEGRGGFGC